MGSSEINGAPTGTGTGKTNTRLSQIFKNEQKIDETTLKEAKSLVKVSSKSEVDRQSFNQYERNRFNKNTVKKSLNELIDDLGIN